jgi:predicted nucleotidyltransferase
MKSKDLTPVLERFVEGVKNNFGDNLESVILYGSAATGAYLPGVSDINVLVLIRRSDPVQVFAFGKEMRQLIRKERFTPQILMVSEFLESADIFPLEYHELKGARKVLYGDDTVKRLEITKANLRHQVEAILRGSIATLRQILTAAGGDAKQLSLDLVNWGGNVRTLYRGLLRLKGVDPSGLDDSAVSTKIGELFGIDASPFNRLAGLRSGRKDDPLDLAASLTATLVSLTGIVNAMEETAS